jgi:hypothetical protein
MLIDSPHIHGMKACRETQYYVNPSSDAIIELGTRAYPYKSINLALIEMFNHLSGNDVTITLKLSRSDPHYIKHHAIALNDITHVIFEPYDPTTKQDYENEYGKHSFKF